MFIRKIQYSMLTKICKNLKCLHINQYIDTSKITSGSMNKLQCKLQNILNGIQKNIAYEN